MPAPSGTMLTASRTGTAARHTFFRLDHSQGVVRAWDGIGEFVFGGETYLGVAGFISVSGISDSGDIQNHGIEVRLNGVPLSAIVSIDPSISDDEAKIWAVWINESGTEVANKLLFSGSGNFIKLQPGETEFTIIARLKPAVADWSFIPRSYYSSVDQKALFAGDTGCDQTEFLENATIAGWQSPLARQPFWEWSNADQGTVAPFGPDSFSQPRTFARIGNNTHGINTVTSLALKILVNSAGTGYVPLSGTGSVEVRTLGGPMLHGGEPCTIDAAGDVITPGGQYVTPATNRTSAFRLRKATKITTVGAATAEQIVSTNAAGFNSKYRFRNSTGTLSGADLSGLIFDDATPGYPTTINTAVTVIGGKTLQAVFNAASGVAYEEEGTGWQCVFNFTDSRLWVWNQSGPALGGACVMSANGAVLGPNGGKIIPVTGGLSFLRKWT